MDPTVTLEYRRKERLTEDEFKYVEDFNTHSVFDRMMGNSFTTFLTTLFVGFDLQFRGFVALR